MDGGVGGVVSFSDGTGSLTGFHGHADVSEADGVWSWEGTYSFD